LKTKPLRTTVTLTIFVPWRCWAPVQWRFSKFLMMMMMMMTITLKGYSRTFGRSVNCRSINQLIQIWNICSKT